MSEQQYTALLKWRLTDLVYIPSGTLMAFLSKRPEWIRKAVIQSLMRHA